MHTTRYAPAGFNSLASILDLKDATIRRKRGHAVVVLQGKRTWQARSGGHRVAVVCGLHDGLIHAIVVPICLHLLLWTTCCLRWLAVQSGFRRCVSNERGSNCNCEFTRRLQSTEVAPLLVGRLDSSLLGLRFCRSEMAALLYASVCPERAWCSA